MDAQLRNGMLLILLGLALLFTTLVIHFPLIIWAMILAASFIVNAAGSVKLYKYIKRS